MILAAVEGYPDEEVVRKILDSIGLADLIMLRKRGKGDLDAAIPELNRSANSLRCLIVRDMDNDAKCPAELLKILVPHPSKNLLFRVAEREIESWLLGDVDAFAAFLDVPRARFPESPDLVKDPKSLVTTLAAKSKNRRIREDMPPRPGSGIAVGPGYAGLLGQFARDDWRPGVAMTMSPSLRRCISRLQAWR
ncbi:MAG TPA: hypothetical protein VKX28_13915 [Xanthobacteraceae bacterium]|nr:hypothetical protein [Xanthobacteraceae bacterium]